jgi:hypothetical protein
MPGPYSPNDRVGTDGPPFSEPHPSQPIAPSAGYPGLLPPPVVYPKRRSRRRLVLTAAVTLVLIAGLVTAILRSGHSHPVASGGVFPDAAVKTAIQGYLDALEHRDIETIARNTLCGIYDAVKDRRSDQAVAKLSSDAFRKQFSEVHVTSIDKIVYWSEYQAQVLFSMRVALASGGKQRDEVQGSAQLLNQHNQLLVCSYVLRTAGSY